jgi:localization factor PodJL
MMRQLRDDLARSPAQRPAQPFVERRSGERRADVTPIMNELRADLTRLRDDIAELASQPSSARLEASVRELAERLDQRGAATPHEDLARPLSRIEAELSRLHAQDPGTRFGRIEAELQRLGDRLEALATQSGEPRLLSAALSELAGLKDALGRQSANPRMDDLARQIADLSQDMARIREHLSQGAAANDVESAIESMRAQLMRETREAQGVGQSLMQRILHQLDGVSAAVSAAPSGALGDVERRQLADLSHKLDQLAARAAPESGVIARQIEALAQKLDAMSDHATARLAERVDNLAEQIERLSTRGPAALEKQIDLLAARLETLARETPSAMPVAPVDLTPIEVMIQDLARRIDDAARPEASHESLQSLERQLERLTERLDRPEPPAPAVAEPSRVDGLESTLQDLMRYLGGLRDETAHAVDRAARAAVEDALTRQPARLGIEPGDLTSLRSDIAGLRDVHSSIDQRTSGAIGAVNDTLETIARRLGQLESDLARERTMPLRPAAVDAPMPYVQPNEESRPRWRPAPAAEMAPPSRPVAAPAETMPTATMPAAPPAPVEPSPAVADEPFRFSRVTARSQSPRDMLRAAARSFSRTPAGDEPALAEARPLAPAARDALPAESLALADEPVSPARPSPSATRSVAPSELDTGPDSLPDVPLEPGSGRPRPRGEGQAAGLNPSLIAAARRAAMAASAEVEANKAQGGKPGAERAKAEKGASSSLITSVRETLDKRRKPILLGLAAIVLAIGAGQVATTMLGEPSAPVRTEPAQAQQRPASAEPVGQARIDSAPAESARDASTPAARPDGGQAARERTSSAAPLAAPLAPVTTTGSITPAMAPPSLTPQAVAPEAGSFNLAPGRVTDLGELPPALGTPGLRRAALAGDANAVYELAARAADGPAAQRDQRLALRLFERAAAAGSAPAQFRLANMHEKGVGTTRDAKLAVNWYRRAAEKGNAKAIHNLAVLIAEGADGRPDYAEAAALFRRAAEFGVRDSQYNLAVLLGRGLGVEQDMVQSFTWFAVAARQGDADAARKRDEVGVKLTPVDLAAARTASLNWRAKTPDPAANEVSAPPGGWDPAPRQPSNPARPRST